MSKYNVGDVVKLRDDLECDKDYGHVICFVSSMNHLKRKPVVIEVCEKESCGEWYRVEDAYWNITDEMIEGLWEECKEKQDKLKLIDVLNMIAKGELKEGAIMKLGVLEYTYKTGDFVRKNSHAESVYIFDEIGTEDLNTAVELIEPHCEHEWEVETIPTKIEELGFNKILTIEGNVISIINKLNELINKVNVQTEVILAHRKDIDEIKEQLDY
jgi:hypothetical protein